MSATRTDPPRESMGIDPYERNWMRLTIVLLVVFAAAVGVAGFAGGFQVPGDETRVNPQTVTQSGPFADPGVREIVPGEEYEVYMVARMWAFDPGSITVPVGSKVTFYVTSVDVQHGVKLQDTNVNVMVVPGEISKISTTFEKVGEYPFICNEYCGQGHAAMFGTLKVVAPGQETGGES